jgi:hypothetical protein
LRSTARTLSSSLIGAIILFLTNLIAMNSQLRKENWGEVRNDTMEKITI